MLRKLTFIGAAIMLVGIIVFGTGAVVRYKVDNPDFARDHIIISLTHEATLLFLDYTPEDFAEVGATEVEDLTKYTKDWVRKKVLGIPTDEEMLVNIDNYKCILSIRFDKKSKREMRKAADILNSREDVEYAGFSYPMATPERWQEKREDANDILKTGAIIYGVGLLAAITFLIADRRKN